MDFKHMLHPPAFQPDDTRFINKVFLVKKDEVHRRSIIRPAKTEFPHPSL
jgi:hypothetical protein